LSGREIIVVEGRADVLTLLENRVNNVIGMNGTKLPKDVIELSKSKKITLFLDGDRGGKLIAKNVIENANIDFVAFAPDGKEVEELNGKEILASLRKKIPAKEFSSYSCFDNQRDDSKKIIAEKEGNKVDIEKLREVLVSKIEGSKKAYLLDDNLNIIKFGSATSLKKELFRTKDVAVIAIDGKATLPIIEAAEEYGCRYVAAKNFVEYNGNVELVSF
jgi:DNA primase